MEMRRGFILFEVILSLVIVGLTIGIMAGSVVKLKEERRFQMEMAALRNDLMAYITLKEEADPDYNKELVGQYPFGEENTVKIYRIEYEIVDNEKRYLEIGTVQKREGDNND